MTNVQVVEGLDSLLLSQPETPLVENSVFEITKSCSAGSTEKRSLRKYLNENYESRLVSPGGVLTPSGNPSSGRVYTPFYIKKRRFKSQRIVDLFGFRITFYEVLYLGHKERRRLTERPGTRKRGKG